MSFDFDAARVKSQHALKLEHNGEEKKECRLRIFCLYDIVFVFKIFFFQERIFMRFANRRLNLPCFIQFLRISINKQIL